MTCKKCGFEMTGKKIDSGITVYRCPLGHKYIDWQNREATYPHNLEKK